MTDRKFNARERHRYRQAGLLLAAGSAMVMGAFVWLVVDTFSASDGVPGAWLTIPGVALVFGGLRWSDRVLRSAAKRWEADPS